MRAKLRKNIRDLEKDFIIERSSKIILNLRRRLN
jgi:hypothetical protein